MIVSATKSEASRAMVTVMANELNSSPDETAGECNGEKDSYRRNGRGSDSASNLLYCANDRSEFVRLAVLPQVSLDVFQHHDGVVNHAPNRDGQSSQRQNVE